MTRSLTEVSDKHRSSRRSEFNTGSKKQGLEVIHEKSEDFEDNLLPINADKRLKIYDSHAVDYSRYADVTKKSRNKVKLPPKKTKYKDGKELTVDVKTQQKPTIKDCEQKLQELSFTDKQHDQETGWIERRRSSQFSARELSIDALSGAFLRQPTHDTLGSFLKYYREQRTQDQKLKNVQSRAKVKTPINTEQKATSKPIKTWDHILPVISRKQQPNNTGKPTVRSRWKRQLPKVLSSEKRKRHVDTGKDTRFERLLSTLQPVYTGETTTLPFLNARNTRSHTI